MPQVSEFFLEFANGLVALDGEFSTLVPFGADGSESCSVIGHSAFAGRAHVNAKRGTESLFEVGFEFAHSSAAIDFKFCHNDLGVK